MLQAPRADCGQPASPADCHIKGFAGIYWFWQDCRKQGCFQWEPMHFSVDFRKGVGESWKKLHRVQIFTLQRGWQTAECFSCFSRCQEILKVATIDRQWIFILHALTKNDLLKFCFHRSWTPDDSSYLTHSLAPVSEVNAPYTNELPWHSPMTHLQKPRITNDARSEPRGRLLLCFRSGQDRFTSTIGAP